MKKTEISRRAAYGGRAGADPCSPAAPRRSEETTSSAAGRPPSAGEVSSAGILGRARRKDRCQPL